MEKRSIIDQSTLVPIGLVVTVAAAIWMAASLFADVRNNREDIERNTNTLVEVKAENTALNVRLIRIEENTNRLLKIFENYEININ